MTRTERELSNQLETLTRVVHNLTRDRIYASKFPHTADLLREHVKRSTALLQRVSSEEPA